MRRFNQEISQEECKEILKTAKRAVLSLLGEEGYPYGIPMNFYYDEAENTIYFHSAKQGHKIDALKSCNKACFTTWDNGYQEPGDWSWHLQSVIARGWVELVQDLEVTTAKTRLLGYKYNPSKEEVETDIAHAINHVQLLALHIEHLSGKKVHER